MPAPQRIPSLPGATQGTKRAFKPPARVTSDTNSEASAPKSNARPSNGAAKFNASRPTSANSSRAGSAAPSRPVASKPARALATSGFTRATNPDDIEMVTSDEEDLSVAFESITARPAPKTAARTADLEAEPELNNTMNKRQRLTRLPSLEDSSSEPTRGLSPIDIDDFDESPRRNDQPDDAADDIGADTDEVPLLPAPLLTRLLHESFSNKEMKISRDANALMARYMDVFVREAVARAALAQRERVEGVGTSMDDGLGNELHLDTKDLEEIAPGLVLDF